MGARSIAGGRGASLARARDATGKFWKKNSVGKFGRTGKIWDLDVQRLT